jgi:alpha-1,6-mannosyltransferase
LPLLWRRVRIRDAALALALPVLLYLPFLRAGGLPVGSLGAYLAWWRVNAPLYVALTYVLPKAVLTVLPAVLGLAVAGWARMHWAIDSPETWAWPVAVALLFAPTIFPWYLVWVTPFLFSQWTLPLAVWSVSILATYSILPGWAIGVIEYGAVAISIGWMIRSAHRFGARRQ